MPDDLFIGFNSKLVRLEGNPTYIQFQTADTFQFQTGSIRREQLRIQNERVNKVSIPNWFD